MPGSGEDPGYAALVGWKVVGEYSLALRRQYPALCPAGRS
jgi:hypothetical protein